MTYSEKKRGSFFGGISPNGNFPRGSFPAAVGFFSGGTFPRGRFPVGLFRWDFSRWEFAGYRYTSDKKQFFYRQNDNNPWVYSHYSFLSTLNGLGKSMRIKNQNMHIMLKIVTCSSIVLSFSSVSLLQLIQNITTIVTKLSLVTCLINVFA